MKQLRLQIILIILLIVSTLCNSQIKTSEKIIKTQGTSQYANIHCGLQDKAGNLWFGTTGEGVYRYDGQSFINFTMHDGLGSNDVWCIYEDKDSTIWLGTGAGLYRYNSSALSDTSLKPFSLVPITTAGNSNLLIYTPPVKDEVWSILQDKTGKFWIGTSNGVYCYNGKKPPEGPTGFRKFLDNDSIINKDNLRLKHIQCIIEDKSGNIWFASWNQEGACCFDGKTATAYKPNGDGMVHAIMEDKNGKIWFGTRNHGACFYDGKTFGAFQDIEKFSSVCVYSMAEDKAGTIWFATEPYGLWSYNPSNPLMAKSKTFANFTTENGLCNNAVFSVTVDKSGKIWLGTRGIALCNYDGKTFTGFAK